MIDFALFIGYVVMAILFIILYRHIDIDSPDFDDYE